MFKGYGQLQGLLKEAHGMQAKMQKVQQELAEKIIEGSAGGGMVVATVNGKQEVIGIKISPEILAANDTQMLQDLIVAAVNQGIQNARELMQQELSKVTGAMGLNIPGLF